MLHRIVTRVGAAPGNGEILARPPSYFIVPDGAINAFRAVGNVIAVNVGVFYEFGFNEDMAAFIVTHEMGHGVKQHSLRQLEGILPLQIARELIAKRYGEYIPELQYRLAGLVLLHIRNNGYSVPFEYEADNTGFEFAVNAGYNPGGAGAAFVRMNSYYEDKPSLFQALFNPRTHPTNQKRIENFANKLATYSGNNISVNGTGVYVKGQLLLNTKPIGERMAEERAFLIAGNLARVFHHSPRPTEPATVVYGTLMFSGRRIITPVPGEPTAEELCSRLNGFLGFPDAKAGVSVAGTPKVENLHWVDL